MKKKIIEIVALSCATLSILYGLFEARRGLVRPSFPSNMVGVSVLNDTKHYVYVLPIRKMSRRWAIAERKDYDFFYVFKITPSDSSYSVFEAVDSLMLLLSFEGKVYSYNVPHGSHAFTSISQIVASDGRTPSLHMVFTSKLLWLLFTTVSLMLIAMVIKTSIKSRSRFKGRFIVGILSVLSFLYQLWGASMLAPFW